MIQDDDQKKPGKAARKTSTRTSRTTKKAESPDQANPTASAGEMTSSRGGKSAARSGKSAASNREAETTTVGTTPPSKELTSKAATAIGKSKPRSTIARPQPTFEEISRRAYEIFLGRGGAPGDPMADWLQAERELSQKAFAR